MSLFTKTRISNTFKVVTTKTKKKNKIKIAKKTGNKNYILTSIISDEKDAVRLCSGPLNDSPIK